MRDRRGALGRSRLRQRAGVGAAFVTLALLTGGCNFLVETGINNLRTGAGEPKLTVSSVLNTAAQAHSQAMCTAGVVSASPAGSYAQESALAVHELVGSAPLDPSITNVGSRNGTASNQIWAQWRADPALVDTKWNDMGVGEATCPDGNLYMTAVLREDPTMPASGLYSSAQYDPSTVQQFLGIQYTSAVDYTGTTIPLLLDVFTPPASAPSPRPTIILIHGGAFVGGSRTDDDGVGLLWAERGYDAVSIDYRLDQSLRQDSSPPKEIAAATNATIDAEQAVRWIKANAATYCFDPTRIAANGNSAGGAVALGMSAAPDFQQTGPNATFSSKIAAAISDGAYLTPAIEAGVLHLTAGLAPVLMFHYETDAASNTGAYAFETCSAYRDAGSTCDYVSEPGEGHTTDLTPTGPWWRSLSAPSSGTTSASRPSPHPPVPD
jgi:dienelactone hydrolase